ncbi:MAG: hypothetical protein ACRCZB_03040 [Bacteroidales bacterium]
MKVEVIELSGFVSALQALRLPFGLETRSYTDSEYSVTDSRIATKTSCVLLDKDIELMSRLVKAGDEHAKAIRGINVTLSIGAPRYFWAEMDTYEIGQTRLSSESTMHIQGKGMSTEELVKMKESLTEGTMQKRIGVFNYQCLRRIYFQRKTHRLPIWKEFCKFIESLPYANQLITIK